MPISDPISTNILADYITTVHNACIATTPAPVWNNTNHPITGFVPTGWEPEALVFVITPDVAHKNFGTSPALEPLPSLTTPPSGVGGGEYLTTNIFYLLHGFAIKLTRHRIGEVMIHGTAGVGRNIFWFRDATDVRVSLNPNNVIWFDYPPIPAIGTPITASIISNYLIALRDSVQNIQRDVTLSADIVACHASCHTAVCHGSRGRR